ncbi:dihydropteroate synthase [SAR202 cluster bacterium AC-647-N09_OGT_505m]|nr:dihydropteroate synthase [SAR202 cluster bacterium AC-647-N09_OGT_505m]
MDFLPRVSLTRCGDLELEWGKRTYIMGIVNVTPDSFSGDGLGYDAEIALEQALRFQQQGAHIIDVGGESTRPGSTPVHVDEEKRRVIPVIRLLASRLIIPISIDTHKYEVAQEALAAGASMINDVWGLKKDPALATLAARENVPIILMHNQRVASYTDLVQEVMASLRASLDQALEAGVSKENVILDPGLGFGKEPEHNLELIRRLEEFKTLGHPILVGTSRKSTIGVILDLPVEDRLEGTAATVSLAIANGADMIRVHDVKAMSRVARMSDAIVRGWAAERATLP